MTRLLCSPLLIALVAIAFLLAWFASAGPPDLQLHASALTHAAPVAVIGNLVTAKDIREKRAGIAKQANDLLEKAGTEKRELNAEEQTQFETMHGEITRLGKQAVSIEDHEALMKDLSESRGTLAGRQDTGVEERAADKKRSEQLDQAFDIYIRHGIEGLDAEQRTLMSRRFVRGEADQRAAQTVTTSGGGYLIPQGFSAKLEESLKLFGGVEDAATVFETETGNTLPYPTVDDTTNTGRLLAINTAVTETAVTYGVVNFAAYKFSSDAVTVPVELLQDSAFDLNTHLASVLATRLGRVHNTYETTGTGSAQPQGIVAGSSSGVTAAATSVITYDELVALEHSVDPSYRNKAFGAGFMFNDGTLLKLRQIKDGEGRPLWQAGTQLAAPDTINGWPYVINQDMAAMTTGLKPVLYGAIKKFMVRKVKGFTLLRLVERYADLHQVGFIAFTRMDSRMLDAGTDPCKYITMA